MAHSIFFYTGTGNSLWVARKLGLLLNAEEPIAIHRYKNGPVHVDTEGIGLVFPVHIWGVPPPVVQFVSRLEADPKSYVFAVAVNAGQVAETLLQLKKLLHQRHLPLSSGFSLELPSNYIVWRGAITKEKQQKKFIAATNKLERIAPIILEKKVLPPEKGPFWQNPLFSWVYRKSYPRIGQMDKSFFADEKCNACGICANVCPAQNIVLSGGKPAWLHRCEQCFACIQWCPEEAIQAGRNTKNKVRYHHPDISLKDMLAFASQKENRRPI